MNVFSSLEHATHIPWVISSAVFATVLLVLIGLRVRSTVAQSGGVVPEEGLSVRNVLEVIVEMLADLGETAIGDDYRRYFPIVGTIFLFVLISNLMSLVPGMLGATSDVNTTAAWAILSFLTYTAVGIKKHGWKYIYKFMGPSFFELKLAGKHYHVRVLAPVFLVLEIPLDLARIVTLAIRLLANMFADHMVVMVWISLVPIAIPAIFMGLGILVSFLQAFVFALLTMIYIRLALDEVH